MGEFEEKFNAILGDPQAMGQIMALAQSLGGGGKGKDTAERQETQSAANGPEGLNLDPRLLQLGSRLLGEFQRGSDPKSQLLLSLRPFLRPERQETLEKAVQAVRLSRVIRMGLEELGRVGGDV